MWKYYICKEVFVEYWWKTQNFTLKHDTGSQRPIILNFLADSIKFKYFTRVVVMPSDLLSLELAKFKTEFAFTNNIVYF